MGNCMIKGLNRNLVKNQKEDELRKEKEEASEQLRSKTSSPKECDDVVDHEKKNVVKHKISEKHGSNDIGRSGNSMTKKGSGRVVRIRVVVTKSELSQIMNESSKYSSSVEQLLSTAIMLRNRRMSQSRSAVRGGRSSNGKWKPGLESIQEDH